MALPVGPAALPAYLGVVDTVVAPGAPVGADGGSGGVKSDGIKIKENESAEVVTNVVAGPEFESPTSDPYSTPNSEYILVGGVRRANVCDLYVLLGDLFWSNLLLWKEFLI